MHVHAFSPAEDGSILLAAGDKKLIVVALGD